MGRVKYILLACLMLFMTVSCEDWFHTDYVGRPIGFGTTQQYYPKTRTSYSPYEPGRIDWNEGDKVAIYMDWDETRNPYKDNWSYRKKGIYEVYGIHENGKESHGSIRYVSGEILKWQGDFSGNDGRANEYPHTFWSVYPSNTTFDGVSFYFKLEDIQNYTDVSGLGLAAYEKDINSAKNPNSEGYVELHYYPMFTTLCVTIDNQANFQIGNSLELYSNDYNIVGDYSVDISKRYDGIEGGTINNVSSIFKNGAATFFIIPREYENDKLYFSLGEKTMSIPETLYPAYKYNIKITTKEVEVEPGFSSFVNGVISAEAHKRGYNWQVGKEEEGRDSNKLYGEFQVPGGNEWKEVPPELIWEIIESVIDLDINNTWEAKEIKADDLNIFPNIRTVNIDASNLDSIEVSNPNIISLNVKSQSLKYVKVDGCDGLTTFTMEGNYSIKDVRVVNNDNLVDFYIKSPTTNDNFYLLVENNKSLTHFEVQQMSGWPPAVDWNAWGLTYRFDIKNCPAFKDYRVSNNAKTW